MSALLCVKIDHVAVLRRAAGAGTPDIVTAANICLSSGADMIAAHLRRDRRHMLDEDVFRLCKAVKGRLYLEIPCCPEMEKIALKAMPHSVCLVPETQGEADAGGGLKLIGANMAGTAKTVEKLSRAGIGVSLFIEPAAAAIRLAHKTGAGAVQLSAAVYGAAQGAGKAEQALENLQVASVLVKELGLKLHAGRGLDYFNARAVASIDGMECVHAGHSVICRALFCGLGNAVAEMKGLVC